MFNSFETILFSKQSKMKIGNTTYVINSYFDKTGKTLNQKVKNLLVQEIQKKS